MSTDESITHPCSECPWRIANHGKKHKHGFYTKANLARLWREIRAGGQGQSCHPTDPSHPDHGAKPDTETRECPGSVILVLRELQRLNDVGGVEEYRKIRRKGLTRDGILYWGLARLKLGHVPLIGAGKLPTVTNDPEIDLPSYLKEPTS
jgi:hypothetical protein